MADLTDADEKAFIDKIICTLRDADIKARLAAKDWDPTQRTTSLVNGGKSATNHEGLISNLEATLSKAVESRRADLDNTYDLASASVDSISGALGKDDQLLHDLRQFRGGEADRQRREIGRPSSVGRMPGHVAAPTVCSSPRGEPRGAASDRPCLVDLPMTEDCSAHSVDRARSPTASATTAVRALPLVAAAPAQAVHAAAAAAAALLPGEVVGAPTFPLFRPTEGAGSIRKSVWRPPFSV